MDERRLEIRVGALLLVAIAGAVALLALMGELTFKQKATLAVEFGHTGNVIKGAPVKLGGVPVGRVEEIILTPNRRDENGDPLPVKMDLSVSDEAMKSLRRDAQVTVATQGPLGEPYLELYPGSARAEALPEGFVIRGVDAPRLDLVANRLSNFLESASRVLEEDPRALGKLVSGVQGLTQTVNGVLAENRSDINTLASELSGAAKDLRILAQLARRNLEPGGQGAQFIDDAAASARVMRHDLPQLSNEAARVLAGLSAVSSQLDEEDGKRLKAAIEKYSQAGDRLDGLATRGERILAKLEAGEGTAGAMLKDPQVYDDLKALVTDLKKNPWKVLWKD
ncbi:MAG: MlaD family protein [Myxococcaceae bacterium]